jgi:mono/diheme cytochrome c family protein
VCLFWGCWWLWSVSLTVGGEPEGDRDLGLEAARLRFFEEKVRPLLWERCVSCHGPDKQKGGLRLDSRQSALDGGESGPAVVPGKPDESLLVEAIKHEGLEMPPTGKLEAAEVEQLTRWVAMGAPWPSAAELPRPIAAALRQKQLEEGRNWWSFRPLGEQLECERRGTADIPGGTAWDGWPRNPIDRFLLKAQLENGLTPAPPADRRTLIRRLTFDLIGLPPTPDEVEAFESDPAPDAYERLVERLLSSPRYGQHWARFWLDLVRYAESDGYRQDAYRPHAWRYRDYVVSSFNCDKPYNQFVTEQLAGDELDPSNLEYRVAVGFLRLGTYEFNQRDVRGQWSEILNEITDVSGEVFLGLSVGCARCHDHKFDPIPQRDYDRLRAFFAPLFPRDDLPLATDREQAAYNAKRSAWNRKTAEVRQRLEELERPHRERAAAGAFAKFPDDIKQILRTPEALRTPLEKQLAALANRQVILEREKEPSLEGAEKALRDQLRHQLAQHGPPPPELPAVMSVTDVGRDPPPTVVPGTRKGELVEPGYLSVIDPTPAAISPPPAAPASTGRRLALARWLTQPDHPLTTRVIVNRIWQFHFGRGLVATSSDFGRLGDRPSHPDLLDWLARQMVADGWRLKPLHRLIVTSAAYRQSAERPESEAVGASQIDPENRFLWRWNILRLDAEEIRDAMLRVSGELQSAVLGGPSSGNDEPRRSVELRIIRNSQDPLLDAFDAPNRYTSIGSRTATTTATQALLLANGPWTSLRAEAFARRLETEANCQPPDPPGADPRLVRGFLLAYGRPPDPDEIIHAQEFLANQAQRVGVSGNPIGQRAALVDFCHVLLNSNEFLYID